MKNGVAEGVASDSHDTTLKDSKLILDESKLFPRISLVPFRSFRGPLFPKPVTGQELFWAVSYSKQALDSGLMLAASWPLLKVGQKSKNKNLKKLILCRVEEFLFDFELTSMMMILGHLLEDSWVVLYSVCSKIQLHNFWVGITWMLHRGGKVFFEVAAINSIFILFVNLSNEKMLESC